MVILMKEGVLDDDYGYGEGAMLLKLLQCVNYLLKDKKLMLKNYG